MLAYNISDRHSSAPVNPSVILRGRIKMESNYPATCSDSVRASVRNLQLQECPSSRSKNHKASICFRFNFLDAIRTNGPLTQKLISELEKYFSGIYPCIDQDALAWYKVSSCCLRSVRPCLTVVTQNHQDEFPILSQIARDILAIPGVSISVERLFSSSKHTLSDTCPSMTATSASRTVVAKEWLKKGLSDGVNYLDTFRTIN
jgi:hypothetical protein